MIPRPHTQPVQSIRNLRFAFARRLFFLAAAAIVLPFSLLRASTVTWDASGANAASPTDGLGAWSTGNANWSNGSIDSNWSNTDNTDNAVFGDGGTAGTVTVSGGVDVGNITFSPVASGTYTIASSTVTLTTGTIEVDAASATISSQVSGSVGLFKSGTGTLTLTGGASNNYTGGTTLSAGTLSLGSTTALSSGTLTLSGGTLSDALGSAVSNNINVTASTTTTLVSGVGGARMILGGAIVGSGTLQTDAAGDNFFLQGNNSGFGGTFINNALVFLINANSASAAAAWQANATLFANAAGTYNFGSLAGAGSLQAGVGADVFSIGALNTNTTFSGQIINNGGVGSLIKVGTGSLTLSNANSYSGGTTLSSGTLNITNNSALGSGTLTLSGGTLVNTAGGSGIANNVNVTASTTNTLVAGGGGSFMLLSGSISGSGTLQTDASSNDTVRFNNNNSGFSGTFIQQANNGGIYLQNANSASAAAAWQFNSTVNGGVNATVAGTYNFGSLSGSGILTAAGGADVFSIGALSQNTTFSGTIINNGGTGSLIEAGTGTLILTGANTYSGGTTINSGATLQIGNGGSTGSISGAVVDNGNLVYNYSNTSSVTIPTGSNISGSGNLSATAENITLSGTIAVGGSQSYTEIGGGGGGQGIIITASGTTSLTGSSISLVGDVGGGGGNGTLKLNTSASNGPISLNISLGRSGVFNTSAGLFANSGTGTISVLGSGPGSVGWASPVTLTGAVNISVPMSDSSTLTINPATATASSVSAALSGGMSLVVGGPGTLNLTAANTYTGATAVNGGTLVVSGSLSGSQVNVLGGTLAGSGKITGNVFVGNGSGGASSSIVAPSATLGGTNALRITGNLTLNSDAAYQFNLNSDQTMVSDLLNVSGTLTLAGNLTGFNIGTGLSTDVGHTYVLASAGNISGTFGNALVTGDDITIGAGTYQVTYTSTQVDLTLEAIPEPGTWASILMGFGVLTWLQRRRPGRR